MKNSVSSCLAEEMKNTTTAFLDKIRNNAPLVHNITNFVVMNPTANILLALGASPVMAHSRQEVAEMTGLAGALVINIGTLSETWVEAMLLAARVANRHDIPVILDPVGAGATAYRTRTALNILHETEVAVIRGNASEILSLADDSIKTKGVDSSLALSTETDDAVREIARRYGCIVGISGPTDLITDGEKFLRGYNGVPVMTRVTGLGCGLSTVVAAFCAVAGGENGGGHLDATAAAFGFYGLCGELAARVDARPGSFFTAFLDNLYAAGRKEIDELLRIE